LRRVRSSNGKAGVAGLMPRRFRLEAVNLAERTFDPSDVDIRTAR